MPSRPKRITGVKGHVQEGDQASHEAVPAESPRQKPTKIALDPRLLMRMCILESDVGRRRSPPRLKGRGERQRQPAGPPRWKLVPASAAGEESGAQVSAVGNAGRTWLYSPHCR